MTNRAAQNLGLLDAETDRLLATCRSLSATDLHRSTLCAGWDAAHLLTHLARNADALSNLVLWATDGMKRPAYASTEQRDNDIRTGAGRSHEEILTDVETTAVRFRELADALKGKPGDAEVRTRTGTMVKGHQVVAMRTLEVVFHHVDLQAGYNFDNADPSWLARMLRRGVGQWEASGNAPTLTLRSPSPPWPRLQRLWNRSTFPAAALTSQAPQDSCCGGSLGVALVTSRRRETYPRRRPGRSVSTHLWSDAEILDKETDAHYKVVSATAAREPGRVLR